MAKHGDDRKKKRPPSSSPDEPAPKIPHTHPPSLLPDASPEDSSSRPRRARKAHEISYLEEASSEKSKKDVSPEQSSPVVDTLLSLHHPNDSGAASTPVDEGEPSFKILLQSTIDLSDDAQGADIEAAGLEVVRRDSLEDLKKFIQNLDGALEDGWQVEVQRGKHGKLNKAFISPSREKFRSRVEVAKHLGVFGKKKLGLKDQCASNGGSKGIHPLTYQRSEIHINPVMIDSDETQAKNAFGDPTRFGKPTHEDPQNEAFQLHGPDTKAHPDGEESSGHRKVSAEFHDYMTVLHAFDITV